jgi:hypothetical protein
MLDAQRADFLKSGSPSAAIRRDRIDRLILLLTEGTDAFSAALNADFGNRPKSVNLVSEVVRRLMVLQRKFDALSVDHHRGRPAGGAPRACSPSNLEAVDRRGRTFRRAGRSHLECRP